MKLIYTLTLFLLLSFGLGAQAKKKEMVPRKSLAKVVLDGKKDYVYYALSEKARTTYKLVGPGKFTLNVRVRLEGDDFSSKPFQVKCIRSGKHVDVLTVPTLKAGNLKFKNKSLTGSPTKSHKVTIDVPPGEHNYTFYKYRTGQKVHVRLFYEQYPKPVWKDISSTNPLAKKVLKFIKSGRVVDYLAVGKKDMFKFSISDSTQIRIIVRPVFTYSMLDETNFKIVLTNERTQKFTTYKFVSKRASGTEIVGDKKVTPGTSSIWYANLDKPQSGSDNYTVKLLGDGKKALLRISVNEKLNEK